MSDTDNICDKCRKPVPDNNNAVLIEASANGTNILPFACGARHFLPTADCEGSPSRAQYIEGQPRDTRGYPYIEANEAKWRRAYAEAQRTTAEVVEDATREIRRKLTDVSEKLSDVGDEYVSTLRFLLRLVGELKTLNDAREFLDRRAYKGARAMPPQMDIPRAMASVIQEIVDELAAAIPHAARDAESQNRLRAIANRLGARQR